MSLSIFRAGDAEILESGGGWRLQVPPARGYADAQLDDTQRRSRPQFLHRPPARLSLQARASSAAPPGTLGFGFWNDPFPALGGQAGAGRFFPAAPQAVWFFHASTDSDLPFAPGAAGSGWRAASLRFPRLPLPALAGVGAAFMAGFAVRPLRRRLLRALWKFVSGAQSPLLPNLDQWHDYEIEWAKDKATFRVDGGTVLQALRPPQGPLGLVLWIDNQWAAFSEERGLRFGVVPTDAPAWLEVRRLRLNEEPVEAATSASRPSALPT